MSIVYILMNLYYNMKQETEKRAYEPNDKERRDFIIRLRKLDKAHEKLRDYLYRSRIIDSRKLDEPTTI